MAIASQITDFNAVQSLCRLFDSLATVDNGVDPAEDTHYQRMVEMWFAFCVVWSIGGAFDESSECSYTV